MHDLMLAKQIIDKLRQIIEEKNLEAIKKVNLEIGEVSLAHDGHKEHTEEINLDNLKFNLENLVKKTALEKAMFKLKKTAGENWKITDIEV